MTFSVPSGRRRSPFGAGMRRPSNLLWGWALGLLGCASPQTLQTLDQSSARADAQLRGAHPAGLDSTDDATLRQQVARDHVVKLAISQSPGLRALAHRARALVHAGRAEAQLPSPELGVQAWNLPLARPYALGEADMYMVELEQRFPARGARDGRARAMAEEARAMLAELATEERRVAEQAVFAFAGYLEAHHQESLELAQVELLQRLHQAARARFTTGGAALLELSRIELEVARAERALERIHGNRAGTRALLNSLLRRAAGSELGAPVDAPAETVRLSLPDLLERAARSRGASLSADARVRAALARQDAARAEAVTPEFMVSLGYWQDPAMRPGLGLGAKMSLPWLWGPGRPRTLEAADSLAAEQASVGTALVEAQAEVSEAQARLVALESQLQVVEGRGLPAARRNLEALAASFSTGGASLLAWVEASREVLDLELESTELHCELTRAVAALERAVGGALPRSVIGVEVHHE